MKEYKGIMFPEEETHLIDWMEQVATMPDGDKYGPMIDGKPTYQYHKYQAVLKWTKQRRVAVDIGAHVGLWSRVMARDFGTVHCFEPVPEYQACWKINMARAANAELYRFALGADRREIAMHCRMAGSSGDTSVATKGQDGNAAVNIPMRRLDDFDLQDVDLVKVDNEGFEYFALLGGLEILKRCKPAVVVEQKPGMGKRFGLRETQAVELLESIGAKMREAIQGDYICSWD